MTSPALRLPHQRSYDQFYRIRLLFKNVGLIRTSPGELVLSLDEEPIFSLLARFSVHTNQMPAAFEFFSIKLKLEMCLFCIAYVGRQWISTALYPRR